VFFLSLSCNLNLHLSGQVGHKTKLNSHSNSSTISYDLKQSS